MQDLFVAIAAPPLECANSVDGAILGTVLPLLMACCSPDGGPAPLFAPPGTERALTGSACHKVVFPLVEDDFFDDDLDDDDIDDDRPYRLVPLAACELTNVASPLDEPARYPTRIALFPLSSIARLNLRI